MNNSFLKFIFYRPDFILCNHINFTPLAYFYKKIFKISYGFIAYGVEVWDIKEKFKIKYFDELYFYKIINKDFVGINFRKSKTEENLWKIFIESSSLYYLNEINKKLKELIND